MDWEPNNDSLLMSHYKQLNWLLGVQEHFGVNSGVIYECFRVAHLAYISIRAASQYPDLNRVRTRSDIPHQNSLSNIYYQTAYKIKHQEIISRFVHHMSHMTWPGLLQ